LARLGSTGCAASDGSFRCNKRQQKQRDKAKHLLVREFLGKLTSSQRQGVAPGFFSG
jgi:hypothetical protein